MATSAQLPILFIVFGLGELSKVMLIVIGITPALALDLEQRARPPRDSALRGVDHPARLADGLGPQNPHAACFGGWRGYLRSLQ